MKLKANWVHAMGVYHVEGQPWFSKDGLEWFLSDGTSVLDCLFYASEIHLHGGPEDGEVVGLDLDEMYVGAQWSAHLDLGDVLIEAAKAGDTVAYRWAVEGNEGEWFYGRPCLHVVDAVDAARYFYEIDGENE